MPAKPSTRPRPGGGFNAGMGQFGEHMDEAAMAGAVQQKALQQQKASLISSPMAQSSSQKNQKSPPSDMGSLTEELFVKPFNSLVDGFKSIADLNMWLGIEPTEEEEQERERKKVMLQRYNQMTDEEQAITKRRYQERMQRLQAEEEEKQRQKELAAQQQQATLQMPTKAASGPVGPGMSKKQKATAQLNFDRQRQDKTAGAG